MAEILLITAIGGAENCAAVLSRQFQLGVDVAASRREALAALRSHDYELMIVDASMLEADDDPAAGDALFAQAGLATPLEVNFAISGAGRLVRLVRSALARRQHEKELALQAASTAMAAEQREAIAGLLLHAQLALTEPGIPASTQSRLRTIVELAARLGRSCAGPEPLATVRPGVPPGQASPPRMQDRAAMTAPATVPAGVSVTAAPPYARLPHPEAASRAERRQRSAPLPPP